MIRVAIYLVRKFNLRGLTLTVKVNVSDVKPGIRVTVNTRSYRYTENISLDFEPIWWSICVWICDETLFLVFHILHPNISKLLKNSAYGLVFQHTSRCLDILMKHSSSCLIYYLKHLDKNTKRSSTRAIIWDCWSDYLTREISCSIWEINFIFANIYVYYVYYIQILVLPHKWFTCVIIELTTGRNTGDGVR